jgi:hypothetical protein
MINDYGRNRPVRRVDAENSGRTTSLRDISLLNVEVAVTLVTLCFFPSEGFMPLGNVVQETMVRLAPESNRTHGKTSTFCCCIVRTIA